MRHPKVFRIPIVVWIGLLLLSCMPAIGPYSPVAYENATSLKAATIALMDRASEPYASHRNAVETLLVDIDKAFEFVQGVPSNSISAAQWDILRRSDGDLLGKFFRRWKEDGTLSKTYIVEFKAIVADAFDEIICLEANKKEATKCRKN